MAHAQLSVDSLVWVKLASGWAPARVVKASQGQDLVLQVTGSGIEVTAPATACLLQNSASDEEDMTHLTHLHEPGVLHNLAVRYARQDIYTCTGSILLAVNPFQAVPKLFQPDVLAAYQACCGEDGTGSTTHLSELPPHVYRVACAAYRQMLQDNSGQAILITGESGAGKTETSKLIMRCLASLGSPERGHASSMGGSSPSSNGKGQGACGVEQKVLESNPLLEAFGNAKTLRNDNSSRFGKYVEISFTGGGVMKGAGIRTYLLERSRVVHVAQGERNFHAFYQMCAGASSEERARWQLGPAACYSYLQQSDCMELPHVDDAAEYQHTRQSMDAVGVPRSQQDGVFAVLAAVLHLGNVCFREADHDHSQGPVPSNPDAEQALKSAASLLGVPADQLLLVLTTRTRQTPDGTITSPLSPEGAEESRNALAKVLYARTFDWLVSQVNAALSAGSSLGNSTAEPPHTTLALAAQRAASDGVKHKAEQLSLNTPTRRANGDPATPNRDVSMPLAVGQRCMQATTIGLLDIYGFESFENNDLEQLCINFANEKLQQHFNQHIFKWEQSEYVAEGIDWRWIEFVDNQEVVDLIEGRLGLLDLLDEQCRFPTSTADDLVHKYSSTPTVTSNKRFERLKRPPTAFAVDHYAGPVRYLTDNFMAKNKDFVVAEHAALLAGSQASTIAGLFAPAGHAAAGNSSAHHTPGAQAMHRSSSAAVVEALTHTPSHMHPAHRYGSAATLPAGGQSGAGGSAVKSSFKFDSVGSQFKRQLADLMAALNAMQPHYVRCIKPNPSSRPGMFDANYVLQQLKCGGVMEAVRISCAGFAYRRPYATFLNYFWPLCPSAMHAALSQGPSQPAASSQATKLPAPPRSLEGALERCPVETLRHATERILTAAGVTDYQLGHTKLFLRPVQSVLLDSRRASLIATSATTLQAGWRGFVQHRRFLALRAAAVVLQRAIRTRQAQQLAFRLRMTSSALVVQAAWRGRQARQQLARARAAATVLQAGWRCQAARGLMQELRREAAALVYQSCWRSRSARAVLTAALQQSRAARCMQAAWRGRQAHRAFLQQLPLVRAAITIQRAWRSSRQGERLREAFRQVVLQVVQRSKAAVVLQRVWRTKEARLRLQLLAKEVSRQRFKAQLQGFQVKAAANHAGAAAGADVERDTRSRQASLPVPLSDTVRRWGGPNKAKASGQQQQTESDVVRAPDVAPEPFTPRSRRLQELKDFKLSPLLQMWQTKEAKASAPVTSASKAPPLPRPDTGCCSSHNTTPQGWRTSQGRPAGAAAAAAAAAAHRSQQAQLRSAPLSSRASSSAAHSLRSTPSASPPSQAGRAGLAPGSGGGLGAGWHLRTAASSPASVHSTTAASVVSYGASTHLLPGCRPGQATPQSRPLSSLTASVFQVMQVA
ncbi:hypothetical protein QJQ45_026789 [Haematococcus lacustris]|nr:hypothetical protein QJQ45_026789 [Haematococcus lacustris]